MKNSSVAQLALDLDSPQANDTDRIGPSVSSVDTAGLPSAPLKLPDFARYPPAYAATARIAGRINASAISEKEHEALLGPVFS